MYTGLAKYARSGNVEIGIMLALGIDMNATQNTTVLSFVSIARQLEEKRTMRVWIVDGIRILAASYADAVRAARS